MKMIGIYLLTAVLCSGCVYKGQNAYDGVSSLYPEASQALATDAAGRLAMAFPPGHTALSVDTESTFGKALEGALRRKGFTLSDHGLTVDYNVDVLRDEAAPTCYVRLGLPDGGSISQMYNIGKGMVIPAGNVVKAGLPSFDPANMPSTPEPVAEIPLTEPLLTNPEPSTKLAELPPMAPILPRTFTPGEKAPLPVAATKAAPVALAPSPVQIAPLSPSQAVPVPEAPLVATALQEAKLEAGIPAVSKEGGWNIAPGMLRSQLESWTSRAGYQLIWKARHDFEMQSQVIFRDDFVGAVKRLFARMHLHGNPLRATIYQDNRVLEVVEE